MFIDMDSAPYLSGQFLLATPGMGDPRFAQSIIAMCAHDENGALGINLGEPATHVGFAEVAEQMGFPLAEGIEIPVFVGGPVEPERGFILHSLDYNPGDSMQVADRWGLSSSQVLLEKIALGEGPEKAVLALGYAGWGGGQLDDELTRNGWSVAQGDPEWIFDFPASDKWQFAWEAQGIDPRLLSGDFGSA